MCRSTGGKVAPVDLTRRASQRAVLLLVSVRTPTESLHTVAEGGMREASLVPFPYHRKQNPDLQNILN